MLFFVMISSNDAIWANKERALYFLEQGYRVYTDETMQKEVTAEYLAFVEDTEYAAQSVPVYVESTEDGTVETVEEDEESDDTAVAAG